MHVLYTLKTHTYTQTHAQTRTDTHTHAYIGDTHVHTHTHTHTITNSPYHSSCHSSPSISQPWPHRDATRRFNKLTTHAHSYTDTPHVTGHQGRVESRRGNYKPSLHGIFSITMMALCEPILSSIPITVN